MSLTDLRALAAEVLALDEKATKGPWEVAGHPDIYIVARVPERDEPEVGYVAYEPVAHVGQREARGEDGPNFRDDANDTLITRYRTLAPRLARAVERLLAVAETSTRALAALDECTVLNGHSHGWWEELRAALAAWEAP